MPTTCAFELNKQNSTYYSGETITGKIILYTTSDKSVRDVSIILLGEGKVKYQEYETKSNSSGDNTTDTTCYSSHEVYLNNSTVVHGDGILPAGTHAYTFTIPLPLECPTSLEEKYGYIRYEISLKLNRPFRFDNVFKKPITIIRTIDLNLNPAYKVPLVLEKSGKISYTLKIPYGAYAPGQLVKYSLRVANQTSSDTKGYEFEFTKKITFTAKSPSRTKREIKEILVRKALNDTCLRLTNRLFEGQFVIPAVPPSTSQDSIICIEYKLKVTVTTSGWNRNAELKIPIIIGTIPVRDSSTIRQNMPNSQADITPTAPELPMNQTNANIIDMPPSYQDLNPPSFEEATRSCSPFVDTDVEECNRIVGFRPLYPMYK